MTRRLDKVMPVLLERMVATGEIERLDECCATRPAAARGRG